MSRNWNWDQKDNMRVMDWAIDTAKKFMAHGDSFTASEIFTGVGNLLALQSTPLPKTERVNDWIWGIYSGIYDGILYEIEPPEPISGVDHSVLGCLRLLNAFFELNDLNKPLPIGTNTDDLIIPESF